MPRDFEMEGVVPIYGLSIILNVSDDLAAARKKHNDKFGVYEDENPPRALTEDNEHGYIGIFFTHQELDKGIIAHEIYHATGGIMAYVGIQYDYNNDEAPAYLNDWITEWIYIQLESRGEVIRTTPKDPQYDEPDLQKD